MYRSSPHVIYRHGGAINRGNDDGVLGHGLHRGDVVIGDQENVVVLRHLLEATLKIRYEVVCDAGERLIEANQKILHLLGALEDELEEEDEDEEEGVAVAASVAMRFNCWFRMSLYRTSAVSSEDELEGDDVG